MDNKFQLLFIPSPISTHRISTVEAANLLLHRDHRLSITVLLINFPGTASHSYTQNSKTTSRLRFIPLPDAPNLHPQSPTLFFDLIENQIDNIRRIISDSMKQNPISAIVVDMFCSKFIQLGDEFNLPAFVFYTASASSLGLFYDVVSMKYEQNQTLSQYKNSNTQLSIQCFTQPLPAYVLPSEIVEEDEMASRFIECFRFMTSAKGILVNTFYDMEPYAIHSLISVYAKSPKVYPIGPILDLENNQSSFHGDELSRNRSDDIITWLNDQPVNSVVFLCFGTMGCFVEEQVREIAIGLERSGIRFLWSLRKFGIDVPFPIEYENFEQVMPDGFLERTKGIGKVIGWAPQVAVLRHVAVGGFVSHCGWNSVLESIWFGVPIATFPMYAEQRVNAFLLVKELGIAEAARINFSADFRKGPPSEIVGGEDIEMVVRRVMVRDGVVRGKVKELQEKSVVALEEGGCSYKALTMLIEDVIGNS